MHPVVTPWKKKTLKTVNIYVALCWLYTDMDRRVPAMECFKAWRCRFVDCITIKNMDPRHHTLWKVSIYVFKNTSFRIIRLFFFISFVIVYFFRQISINVYEYLWNYLLFWTYFLFFFFFFFNQQPFRKHGVMALHMHWITLRAFGIWSVYTQKYSGCTKM